MKKGLLLLSLCILADFGLHAVDRKLALEPYSQPPGSLSDWRYDNASPVPGYSGGTDLAIAAAAYRAGPDTDLLLHFDAPGERPWGPYLPAAPGSYRVSAGKLGRGAAFFDGRESPIALRPGKGALLGENSEFRDFTVEFWLKPTDVRDGETVLSWQASRWIGGKLVSQELSCGLSKGKLQWRIVNLFSPQGGGATSYVLTGRAYLVPKSWSHHLLRFDFSTGLVEYLLDGTSEAVAYATASGREGTGVHVPRVGTPGELKLGKDYSGSMDELRITGAFVEKPQLRSYADSGARAESPIIDLKYPGSRLKSVEASALTEPGQGMEFLARAANSYADWESESPPWLAFVPGKPLPAELRGRYVQIACNLYPDGSGATSPRLSGLVLTYREELPPPPPARVVAVPGDGEILVSWTRAPDPALSGYRVYYGESPREYFGSGAGPGPSPIDVGDATSIRLDGLTNGKLYYVAVSAYGPGGADQESEFSAEASARPLRSSR